MVAYIAPYPIFQLGTFSILMNEGNPSSAGALAAVDVSIKASHLNSTGAYVSWWVTSDNNLPLPYWGNQSIESNWQSTLPSGKMFLDANGTLTFNQLTYHPDTKPGLDTTFTIHFYPYSGVTMAGYGSVNVTILDDDSKLNGDNNPNVITGTSANDVINARGGNDVVNAGNGNNKISGGDGNDTLTAGSGNDYIRGDAGDDHINGGDGNNTLIGGDGNDRIIGGAGSDRIWGGMGQDTLTGGAGYNKFLYVSQSESGDRITDFTHGNDHIELVGANWGGFAPGTKPPVAYSTNDSVSGSEMIFDKATHNLYYTPDPASDTPAMVLIAHLDNVSRLSSSDFIII